MSNSRRLLVIAVLLIVIISSVAAALIYMNLNSEKLEINFIPDHTNTSPGETGWFLVEIDSREQITTHEISIQTNVSVETDFTYWSQTPLIEVFVYPNSTHLDTCIEIEVTFSAGDLIAHDTAFLYVWNWTFGDISEVIAKRNVFIDYLATSHPEYGIDNTTSWTPIHNGVGILVVGHYLFMSSQWEMQIEWHFMISPYDWVVVYLRPRAEIEPSWAGKIESWITDNQTILEIEPPPEIYRPT